MQANLNRNIQQSEPNLVSQLLFKYLPYWPLFLIIVIFSIAGAWLYLRFQTPLFEATAMILVKDEKRGLDESKMTAALNPFYSKKIIENEVEVLKSKTLLNEVVDNLALYAPIFEETGSSTQKSLFNKTAPVKIEMQNPEEMKGVETVEKIYFTLDQDTKRIKVANQLYPLNAWVTTPFGTLRFSPGAGPYDKQKRLFFFLLNPKEVTLGLAGGLTVSPVNKLSSVINLRIRDPLPNRAEDILNELIKVYNKAAVREKNSLAVNTLNFVEERLGYVSKDLDSIEKKLQQYKASKGAIDIGSQGRLFLENVSSNDQRLSEVNMQLSVLDQVEAYVSAKNTKSGIVPSTLGVSDPVLTKLLDNLYASELNYERLRKTTAENNPLLVSVVDQIEKIRPSIMENIQNQRRALTAAKSNLFATNEAYSSVLQSIPKKERELVEISRDREIKNGIYSFLLQKREEAALSNSATVADNRIIDRAEASLFPVSPNKKLIYFISLVIALFVFVGSIAGKELLNQKILFRKEIEDFTLFPIIGEIAYHKSGDTLVIGEGKKTLLAEQFRKLRTSLLALSVQTKIKKILVTSSISGDGKSFITANLGLSLALAGKKVILLEMDLSNPSLSHKLAITADKGLTNFLWGESEQEEVIKRTGAHQNLFILPSGPLPENPSELLLSNKVESLIEYLEAIFDYVLIDTAPVGALSDAYVLSSYCDATLYVIRHKHTPKVFVQRLEENNKINELKNIALVFNGIKSRGYSKNNYGYGYGYGYTYGQEAKKKSLIGNKT